MSEKKENKKTKQGKNIKLVILKIILAILVLFLILVAGYEISIQWDLNLDKSNPMSKEQVIALLEKGKEYSNYYYSSESKVLFFDLNGESKTETYIKDNTVKTAVDGETVEWKDYDADERIWLTKTPMGNSAFISRMSENEGDTNQYSQEGFDYSLIADEEDFNYDFEYLGEKEIDGRNYVLVECWSEDGSKLLSTKFLIDKETGLIAERRDNGLLGIIIVQVVTDRNVQTDIVTDEDVARPDLSGYTVSDQTEITSDEVKEKDLLFR